MERERGRQKARKIISAHSEWTRPSDEQNRLCSWWLHVKDQSTYFSTNHPTNQISNEMSISEEWADKRPLLSLERCRLNMNMNVYVLIDVERESTFSVFRKELRLSHSLFSSSSLFTHHLQTCACQLSDLKTILLVRLVSTSHFYPGARTRTYYTYKQKAPSPYLTRPRRQQSRCLTSYFNTSFHSDQWTRRKEEKNASMMSNTCCREESYTNAPNLSLSTIWTDIKFLDIVRCVPFGIETDAFQTIASGLRNYWSETSEVTLLYSSWSLKTSLVSSSLVYHRCLDLWFSFPVTTDAIGRLVIISRMPMQHSLSLLFQKQTRAHTSITLIYFQTFSTV